MRTKRLTRILNGVAGFSLRQASPQYSSSGHGSRQWDESREACSELVEGFSTGRPCMVRASARTILAWLSDWLCPSAYAASKTCGPKDLDKTDNVTFVQILARIDDWLCPSAYEVEGSMLNGKENEYIIR